MKVVYPKVVPFLLLVFLCYFTKAQNVTDTIVLQPSKDSAAINKVKETLKERFKDSITYESDTVVAILLKKIANLTEVINTAGTLAETGFDTSEIVEELPATEKFLDIIATNYLSKQTSQNLRSLKTTRGLLIQTEKKLEEWQSMLFEYSDQLAEVKTRFFETVRDSVLRKLPKDSLLRELYFGQLAGLSIRWKQTDSINNSNLFAIGLLQNRVAGAYIHSKDLLENTNEKINTYIHEIWLPEEPSIFRATAASYPITFFEVLRSSWDAFMKMLVHYFYVNINVWVSGIIAVVALFAWIRWLNKKVLTHHINLDELIRNAKLVTENPLLVSAAIILVIISFFLFSLPPAWTTTIWCTLATVFYFLNTAKLKQNNTYRLEVLLLFIAVNLLGILNKSSLTERWLQLLASLFMISYGIFVMKKIRKNKNEYRWFGQYVFFIFTFFAASSFVANMAGSFMLAKTLNNGAVYAVLSAHVLFITAETFIQLIFLQQEAYKGKKLASYFDFVSIYQTLHTFLTMMAGLGWIIIMTQQLNFFDYAYDSTVDFLGMERKLGNTTFNFGSILVFLLIIWVSSLLSKLIFVFFGDNNIDTTNKKSRWGSLLILTRLGILSAGLLVAFAASGIPLDKLTIIIGALGVGIGFGLQNIVNNLVSGVILAFEKPVQIGDSIEIGNRFGVVKQIGIRSSKIVTVEGSEVIVPNGDMLSQHIVNWTLSDNYRRVELIVGVAYDTDLRLAEKLLQQIIKEEKNIEKKQTSLVLAHQFGQSSVDFRLLFWCDIDKAIAVKSDVMIKIHQAFKENNIEIPFPQRDINIKGAEKIKITEPKKEDEKITSSSIGNYERE